jgi:hypothetical protein
LIDERILSSQGDHLALEFLPLVVWFDGGWGVELEVCLNRLPLLAAESEFFNLFNAAAAMKISGIQNMLITFRFWMSWRVGGGGDKLKSFRKSSRTRHQRISARGVYLIRKKAKEAPSSSASWKISLFFR